MASSERSPVGVSVPARLSIRSFTRTRSHRASTPRPAVSATSPPGSNARSTSVRARALETQRRRRRRCFRSASVSDSRTASFTKAEESRYTAATSALVLAKSAQHRGGRLDVRRKRHGLWKVTRVLSRRIDLAGRPHLLKCGTAGERSEQRDRPPSIGDLDRLAEFDKSQQFAGALSQLSYAC